MFGHLKYAIVTLGCLIAVVFAGCQEPSSPTSAEKIRGEASRMIARGLAPASIMEAFEQDGASIDDLAAVSVVLRTKQPALSSGDDDMPNINTTASCEVQGPPTRDPLGCSASTGVCIYKWRNACARTFYEVVDADGNRTWHGPQGCPSCNP